MNITKQELENAFVEYYNRYSNSPEDFDLNSDTTPEESGKLVTEYIVEIIQTTRKTIESV